MDIPQLSNELTMALAPFLPTLLAVGGKVVEGIESKVGEDVWDKVKTLWFKLRPKVEVNPIAKRAMEEVAASPDDKDLQAAMRAQLKKLLAEDSAFAREVTKIWVENKTTITNAIASGHHSAAFAADVSESMVITGDGHTFNTTYVHHVAPPAAVVQNPTPVLPEAKKSTPSKTFIHNLPFASNPFFTGRDKMLDDLRVALCKKTAAAITQPQAVHGLGGVGKTQLAIEYARNHYADYDAVLWAGAASASELHASLANLVDVLKLPEVLAREQEVKVQAVIDWLCSNQRWLLILDNADTNEAQAAVQKVLPTDLRGHVIVTSRRANWPVQFADLEVKVLPAPVAAEFLQQRSAKSGFNAGNKTDAEAVANELGCLPLALEQVGAYITRHHVVFTEYFRLLKVSRTKLLAESGHGGTDYKMTVATTWLVSEAYLSSAARAILQLAAFLAPDEIPRALFIEGGEVIAEAIKILAVENESAAKNQTETPDVENALAELADHSLVELEAEFFSCHRLLQAVLLDRLKLDERKQWERLAVRLLIAYAPKPPNDVRTWPIWNRLQPHVGMLLKNVGDDYDTAVATLMNQFSALLWGKALYVEAESLMRRALTIDERIYGPVHPRVAALLNNLALMLQANNRPAEAESLMRRTLAIDEENHDQETTEFAIHLGNLAELLKETHRSEEAEPLMRRALAIDEKHYGPEHPIVAIRLNNLAQLLKITNRLGEAEPMMRRALVIDEKHYGSEHPEVAIVLNNLALFLKITNRLAEAEPLYRRALAIDEKGYGTQHPKVAARLNNLALLLHDTKRLIEAEPLSRRAAGIYIRSLGPEHPDTQGVLNNYMGILSEMKLSKVEMQAKLRDVTGHSVSVEAP